MSTDDTANERTDADDDVDGGADALGSGAGQDSREGDDGGAQAVDALDQRLVDLLTWVLDTETRARIYVYLRVHPASTSREVAEGTGLYPSTVREALAELNADGAVSRRKREAGGAGNNPYEYEAVAPSDLVVDVVDSVEADLNTVYNLDDRLAGRRGGADPVTITVDVPDARNARDASDARDAAEGPSAGQADSNAGSVGDEAEPVGADDD